MTIHVATIDRTMLLDAKRAYATQIADLARACTLLSGDISPKKGDLVLAVVREIRQHEKIELISGRRAQLFPDDIILVAYGDRYAPDQFEAEVPDDLSRCHLVAGGGVAGRVLSSHLLLDEDPTEIEPLGLLGDADGHVLNLRDFVPATMTSIGPRPLTIASVGTSMNAGKTTTIGNLARGLTLAGKRVGAAKITGTGAGKDPNLMRDAGAHPVFDFTFAGYASTYKLPPDDVWNIFQDLTSRINASGPDVVLIEIADGVYQKETAALLTSQRFQNAIDGVIFSAGDAAGAAMGVQWLRQASLPVIGVSGLLTASPLAMREAAAAIDLPIWDAETTCSPAIVNQIERAFAAHGQLAVAAR